MSEMTAEQIHALADRMDWEVHTDDTGRLVIETGVQDPSWNAEEHRQRLAWERKDREEKRSMRR